MATPPIPSAGSSNVSSLSDWAGGYVTDMLGKAQAVASEPYQVYQGPMTAGESGLQSKVFQGLGSLNFPSNLGQSFSSPMGRQQFGQQPYPSQIPGTGGGMPPPGGFPGYNPYAGRQDTTATGAMGSYAPAEQPMGMRRQDPADIAFEQQLMQQGTSAAGGLPPGAMGMPMQEAMPDYLSRAGTPRAAPTESDWQRTLEMAQFAPGTDMAKAKADFMSGGGKGGYAGPEMGAIGATGGMPMGSGTLGTAQTMPQQGGIAGLTPPQGSQQPSNIAQSYMNPYLQSVLDPQMAELRRQNDITNMQANAKLTGAGAFGGGRQAIMNAENNRNLMMEQNKTVGQGYANAYDKAMGQFNTEQGQARDLASLMSTQGAQQRDIEQQGISADYNEFLAQRDDPMKKTQYLQSMLQGLPISTVSNQAGQLSGIGQLSSTVGGLGNILESLKKFNLA